MKIYFDDAVARESRPRVERIVRETLLGRQGAGALSVSIGRHGVDSWSVFVTGSQEHPLPIVESIRSALERERL
jgi:hypothetical protein